VIHVEARMSRLAVINVVGLTEALIGPHTPSIQAFAQKGKVSRIVPVIPAVTCSAQSTYLTGKTPTAHGVVGNGWYDRNLAEVHFWKQSNRLVTGQKLWEEMRLINPRFTCAKLFWWYNMYSTADYSITPRPMYPADGRKVFDIYSWPPTIREEIKQDLGDFPFATFWGPAAGQKSPQGPPDAASKWIADSAKWVEQKYQPSLSLIYLPHLDYNLQRFGPFSGATGARRQLNSRILPDLKAIDDVVGDLIDFFRDRQVEVVLLSEYGITNVDTPVHLNRLFRERGWLVLKEELGRELLDYGASKAFAVADHQIAHIYVNDPAILGEVQAAVRRAPGVDSVLDAEGKALAGIDHPRAGDLIAIATEKAWFTYYYWLEGSRAPDFARTVDIHRKPGYDPVELFLDPDIQLPKLKIAGKLLKKKMGFRMLMDVIPLDASLVKGSHGRMPTNELDYPVFISRQPGLLPISGLKATDVYEALKRHLVAEI
jgi:predicted AlkP superfamily pyrophosphatase or phosphodiesterase